MKQFKKLFVDHRSQTLGVIETTILIVGAIIGFLTVDRFAVFVRAALGITIGYFVYLEYVVFRRTKDSASFFVEFEFPKDLKYFGIDFFLMIIMVWSSVQVLDLIRYLIQLFVNK